MIRFHPREPRRRRSRRVRRLRGRPPFSAGQSVRRHRCGEPVQPRARSRLPISSARAHGVLATSDQPARTTNQPSAPTWRSRVASTRRPDQPSWPRRPSSSDDEALADVPVVVVAPSPQVGSHLSLGRRQPVGSLDVSDVPDLHDAVRTGLDVTEDGPQLAAPALAAPLGQVPSERTGRGQLTLTRRSGHRDRRVDPVKHPVLAAVDPPGLVDRQVDRSAPSGPSPYRAAAVWCDAAGPGPAASTAAMARVCTPTGPARTRNTPRHTPASCACGRTRIHRPR